MIIAGALVIGVVLTGWLAPPTLARYGWRASPALELTWWLALASAALASTVAAAVLLLLGDHPHVANDRWHACWSIFGHRHVHPLDELAGAALLMLLALTAVRAGRSVSRRIRSQQRAHRAHLAAEGVSALRRIGDVLWLEHDTPFAYSIAGRPGLVVASTALDALPASHRDAVLRHERHHLRHRHHWIVIAAEAVGDALPRVRLFSAAAAATRTLTELTADQGAARHCGAEAVAGALAALGKPERSMALRLRRLATPAQPGRQRFMSQVMACLTSGLMPTVLGGAVIGAMATFAC